MMDQILSGQLSKHPIQDLNCSIALNKGFVLALNYEIRLLKLNSYSFLFKGPVKLIKWVKIAHSFLQSMSDQFHVIIFKLAYVILQVPVKEFFETDF